MALCTCSVDLALIIRIMCTGCVLLYLFHKDKCFKLPKDFARAMSREHKNNNNDSRVYNQTILSKCYTKSQQQVLAGLLSMSVTHANQCLFVRVYVIKRFKRILTCTFIGHVVHIHAVIDPMKRLTAKDALKMPYFNEANLKVKSKQSVFAHKKINKRKSYGLIVCE